MYAHCCEVRVGLHHVDELFVCVCVLGELRHLDHECREHFFLEDFLSDRELALHERIPLLEAVDSLDVSLDIHLAITDLGVVDVVLT